GQSFNLSLFGPVQGVLWGMLGREGVGPWAAVGLLWSGRPGSAHGVFFPRPRDCVRLAARVKVDAGWTFGPQGALHLDSLHSDGAPGGCRGRALCGPALRAGPQASGPPGSGIEPNAPGVRIPHLCCATVTFHRV